MAHWDPGAWFDVLLIILLVGGVSAYFYVDPKQLLSGLKKRYDRYFKR